MWRFGNYVSDGKKWREVLMITLQISLVCAIGSSQHKCHYFGEAGWECSPAGCTFSFSFFSDQKNRDSLSLFAIVSQFPFFGKVVATTPLPFLACGTFKNGAFMCMYSSRFCTGINLLPTNVRSRQQEENKMVRRWRSHWWFGSSSGEHDFLRRCWFRCCADRLCMCVSTVDWHL